VVLCAGSMLPTIQYLRAKRISEGAGDKQFGRASRNQPLPDRERGGYFQLPSGHSVFPTKWSCSVFPSGAVVALKQTEQFDKRATTLLRNREGGRAT